MIIPCGLANITVFLCHTHTVQIGIRTRPRHLETKMKQQTCSLVHDNVSLQHCLQSVILVNWDNVMLIKLKFT